MLVRITVTPECIRRGDHCSYNCPVFLAARPLLPGLSDVVAAGMWFEGGAFVPFPDEEYRRIRFYDAYGKIFPHSFEVEIPDELLKKEVPA